MKGGTIGVGGDRWRALRDRHGGDGHRKGDRDGGRRPAPWLLDGQHARGHVPAVGARLAPRRVGGPHVRGLPRGAGHRCGRDRPCPDRRLSSTTPAGSSKRRASSSTSAWSRPWDWTATQVRATEPSGRQFPGPPRRRRHSSSPTRSSLPPGCGTSRTVPDWSAGLPDGLCSHTCDLVRFHDFAGARVLIVGGRQSAYEWAALIGEHGAEQVDIVHRHEVPRFDRVSWRFADEYVERTVAVPGLVAFAPGLGAGGDRPQVLGGGPPHPRVVADAQAAGGAVPPPPRHVGCRRFDRRRGERLACS